VITMMRPLNRLVAAWAAGVLLLTAVAHAQPLGSVRWQLQPCCNVITVNVTQGGAVYTLDGHDDPCGAAQRAPLVGTATLNPDGRIGFGLHVVTVPGGLPVSIDARITLPTLSGQWTDSAGNSGDPGNVTLSAVFGGDGARSTPPPGPITSMPVPTR
jgi:hypothetical protein